ncbi:hypothetical protein [Ponticaulis profundi]|uniref:Lipoprotein n=1 Tax=Ponticaulis profundi TaxID=2665222 RepID=A0ABW1S7Z9_9PROT
MKKVFAIGALAAVLTACGTTTGANAKTTYSGFDDAAIVTIDPHGNACKGMVCTGIGAQWQEAYPDSVLLSVKVWNDTVGIVGAALNIDGEIVELEEARASTQFEDLSRNANVGVFLESSTQAFIAPYEIVDQIVGAQRVWLRVSTTGGSLEDAVIDGERDSKAYNALKRFSGQVAAAKAKD